MSQPCCGDTVDWRGQEPSVGETDSEPTQNQPADAARRRIGDFELLSELGRGGMGVVYLARQVSLQRLVAMKVLPFASGLDKRQIERFRNEARAAASIQHPNIVSVFEVGCEHGVHFYAMQYIDGQAMDRFVPGDACHSWLDQSGGKPAESPIAAFEHTAPARPQHDPSDASNAGRRHPFAVDAQWLTRPGTHGLGGLPSVATNEALVDDRIAPLDAVAAGAPATASETAAAFESLAQETDQAVLAGWANGKLGGVAVMLAAFAQPLLTRHRAEDKEEQEQAGHESTRG